MGRLMYSPFNDSHARFYSKKVARRAAVAFGRLGGAWRSLRDPCIRVLTYHRFDSSRFDPWSLRPSEFESQLRWLSDHSDVLTPQAFVDAMSGTRPLRDPAVLITIDDGHQSIAEYALPALQRCGIQGVLFVSPGLIEAASTPNEKLRRQLMGWKDLSDARALGHVVAPHGLTHGSLGRMPLAHALEDITKCKEILTCRLGEPTPFFAFPFGTRADYSVELAAALEREGFRYCFTATHGRCIPGQRSVLLPRIKIEGGDEADLFPHIVRGAIDHWRYVDLCFYSLQQMHRM
jgi:peptidoglycan/xylan/chitin deacetylase (PgdA/CDA1 family)